MSADRRGPIAGVVLAAGASTRLGTNKLFVRLGGETVLRRAVGTAARGGLDPVLVVLGHELPRALAELSGTDAHPVVNPDHRAGIQGSLRCGIGAVPAAAPGAVVLLADMPYVTPAMIRILVERFRAGAPPLVISTYAGVLAPPTLYGRSLFAELAALSGDGCGKRVMKAHLDHAVRVDWPAGALADLDLPGDVARVQGLLGGS
jgi:molybdenum cofactor cytidylyltransferase